jgi:hypothetical protein
MADGVEHDRTIADDPTCGALRQTDRLAEQCGRFGNENPKAQFELLRWLFRVNHLSG